MSLELIAYGAHVDKVSSEMRDWAKNAKIEASSLLYGITAFDFLATFSAVYSLLGSLQGITQMLQGRGLQITEAYKMVSKLYSFLNSVVLICLWPGMHHWLSGLCIYLHMANWLHRFKPWSRLWLWCSAFYEKKFSIEKIMPWLWENFKTFSLWQWIAMRIPFQNSNLKR